MPGIAAIISRRPAAECQRLVAAMVTSMEHEPFYTSGTHFVPEMGIYAGWIAHEHSFASSQVFLSEERDIALIFSGECFPGSEIRAKGGPGGHHDGNGGASWLIPLYQEFGDLFFEKLNGLFSGLLIDKRRNKAFLFNDRYGSERVYWCEHEESVYFASEAKALLRVVPKLRAFDEQGLAQYLAFGCTLEWQTLFRGVSLLPGASLWSFEHGTCRKGTYFSPATWEAQAPLSAAEFESAFQETLKRILPKYLESESRIGIALTAGLDTRMIMACLPETSRKPICYTYDGQQGGTLDALLAGRVAAACGLEHQLVRIQSDFFSNFASHADRTVYLTDGCFGVTGAHEIYLNAQARQLSPVRLTGNYGSEVLRGVSTFKPLPLSKNLFSPEMTLRVASAVRHANSNKQHPVTFAAFSEIPWNLFGNLTAGRSQVGFRTPYLDNEMVALTYRAPEAIRRSQLPGLRLVKKHNAALSGIPTDKGYVSDASNVAVWRRRAFSRLTFKLDYLNNEGFPHWLGPVDGLLQPMASRIGLLGLHKYLHYRRWFQRELAGYLADAFTDARIGRSELWNPRFMENMTGEHIRGRRNYSLEINTVLTLEAVERLLFRELPRETEPSRVLEPQITP